MKVTTTEKFCLPVFCVQGALTNENFDGLLSPLEEAGGDGHQHLGLDLSQVSRMDPKPTRLLISARKWLAGHGCSLTILGLSPAAIEALSVAQIALG